MMSSWLGLAASERRPGNREEARIIIAFDQHARLLSSTDRVASCSCQFRPGKHRLREVPFPPLTCLVLTMDVFIHNNVFQEPIRIPRWRFWPPAVRHGYSRCAWHSWRTQSPRSRDSTPSLFTPSTHIAKLVIKMERIQLGRSRREGDARCEGPGLFRSFGRSVGRSFVEPEEGPR